MISAKFLWGNVLLEEKQQIDAKNFNLKFFESAFHMKSVSMPLIVRLGQREVSRYYGLKFIIFLYFHIKNGLVKLQILIEGLHVGWCPGQNNLIWVFVCRSTPG